jgi:DNA invertase Pin-like site-specific DNA recombinase
MESKIEFIALDFPQADRFTVHLLAAFAKFEARSISERTKAALAQAKKRGVRLGAPDARERIGAARAHAAPTVKAKADQYAANPRHRGDDRGAQP